MYGNFVLDAGKPEGRRLVTKRKMWGQQLAAKQKDQAVEFKLGKHRRFDERDTDTVVPPKVLDKKELPRGKDYKPRKRGRRSGSILSEEIRGIIAARKK
jgi:hypothetical protein